MPTILSDANGKSIVMQSTNFEFLRNHAQWRPLADLGGFAEHYAYPDASSSLTKLRNFAEALVGWIYDKYTLPKPYRANFNDLLNESAFKNVVPPAIQNKLHYIRKEGNKSAHNDPVNTPMALATLKESYDVACWLYVAFGNGKQADLPKYTPPQPSTGQPMTPALKKVYIEKIAYQEQQMQQLLKELEDSRAKAHVAEATVAELQAQEEARLAGANAADLLQFDEASTRRLLIDSSLRDASWNVGENGLSTPDVQQEFKLGDQPTPSETGRADYVLFGENGKPLAVVEAKKASKNAEEGRVQAKLYADALEKKYGVRPFIYYTNGHEIFFWNDAANEPPRQVYGFHSRETLEYRRFQLNEKDPRSKVQHNPEIVNRFYQIEGIKRIVELFNERKRKALLVQATGTGKTRVAVALCDALVRAKWVRRVLFLCDRRELLNQAQKAFKEFLPSEPRVVISAETSEDRNQRIYFSTYPAMMKRYSQFDIGFFDLIIADESHRSIYNRYREIFDYFDSYQVGLTATPVKFVMRDTFRVFGCEDQDPTFNYDYKQALEDKYLVPFEVEAHTTEFLRKGIQYAQLSQSQKEQIEADGEDPDFLDFKPEEIDRVVFNKDTNRQILRNLMERGIREATDSHIGKTILFARSQDHARKLLETFNEEYPQYGGKFAAVITSHEPRAETLIEEFKEKTSPLMLAISVDMLDTGVDVPEVVNLVFAKPVFSYAKFWQMIGRGTRLCENLFGAGRHKEKFLIFDHWENFKYFDENFKERVPSHSKALLQQVFEARINLAEATLEQQKLDDFRLAICLIREDIQALPRKSLAVREKWRELQAVSAPDVLEQFTETTKQILRREIAPLMQWIPLEGYASAYRFDRLVAELQTEFLRGSKKYHDHKAKLINEVSKLKVNLTQVGAKISQINEVKSDAFWSAPSVAALEAARNDLRGIMQFQTQDQTSNYTTYLDIREDESQIQRQRFIPKLEGLDLVAYRNRVLKVLNDAFAQDPTLLKIKAGEPVSESDLQALVSLVLVQDSTLNLTDLLSYYPDTAGQLDKAIRGVIGMDAEVVRASFGEFINAHPELNSHQVKFLDLLQKHLSKYGSITVNDLYEAPFTSFHTNGIDGVFDEKLIQELLNVLGPYTEKNE